jgi:hypothetical protein
VVRLGGRAEALRGLLFAFDIIELNGDDLRHDPLESRKATLEIMLAKAGPGIRFNEHMEGDGDIVFRHACKLGPALSFGDGRCRALTAASALTCTSGKGHGSRAAPAKSIKPSLVK